MQETRPSDMTIDAATLAGKLRQEFFEGKDDKETARLMDVRLGQLPNERLVRRVKIGRNDPCPCDSGRKFKKCCINKVRTG